MQKGITVKDGSTVLVKAVYSGDVSTNVMDAYKVNLESLYPGKTVTVYASDQDPEFVAA